LINAGVFGANGPDRKRHALKFISKKIVEMVTDAGIRKENPQDSGEKYSTIPKKFLSVGSLVLLAKKGSCIVYRDEKLGFASDSAFCLGGL
jgi:hypothetical protein